MYDDDKPVKSILVVRLGAMGDLIHTLPAVAALKYAFPGARLTWAVEQRWAPLLEGNPAVDRAVLVRRGALSGLAQSWSDLRAENYDLAIDFQGLIKSALVAFCARPNRTLGFHRTQVRERAAALFYSRQVPAHGAHVVDKNLDLTAAAGAAANGTPEFPLPPGEPEGSLPNGDFVLASPLAGWRSKQWPMEHYARLAELLGNLPLVLNAPPGAVFPPAPRNVVYHYSGLAGLIDATRKATAVVGVDSGPMHLAAALGKAGAALFGPTDPARNGPYGGSLRVLRDASAVTTYKRAQEIDPSMFRISPEQVMDALKEPLAASRPAAERRA